MLCRACRIAAERAVAAAERPRTRATHCMKGHEFTTANTRNEANGQRRCRTCEAARWAPGYKVTPSPRGRKTHCKLGHEYTEENTYTGPGGQRACRICSAARGRRNRARDAVRWKAARGARHQREGSPDELVP